MPTSLPANTNLNILSSVSFQFFILRSPNVNFHIQTAKVPGVSLGVSPVSTPFSTLKIPGDHMDWEEFSIEFLMDEDVNSYFKIWNWLTALGRPNSGYEYKQLEQQAQASSLGIYSDLSLLILDSKRNLRIQCDVLDAFPISLTAMQFDATEAELTFMPVTASFAFRRFNIYPVK
jgi:hypothetical protein